MAEVFAAYETHISVSKSELKTESTTITNTSSYTINNQGNKKVYPTITVTASGNVTLTSITNNSGNTITFGSLSLIDTDVVILDFENQEYTKNGVSILTDLTFSDNELLELSANIDNILEFTLTGTVDLEINYNTYIDDEELHYVENFKINTDNSFNKIKPFNSNKINKKIRNKVGYSFSIGKLSVDWNLYDNVDSDNEYRITYYENNVDTYEEHKRYLVGVTFDRYDKGFTESDGLLIQNISGDSMDILKKEYS